MFSNTLTAVDVSPKNLAIVVEKSFTLVETILSLFTSIEKEGICDKSKVFTASQEQFDWLGGFHRTLVYLIAMKAYHLVRAKQDESEAPKTME
jgi:hypothetical protein